MYEVTPENKKLAELRSRHDSLWKLEKNLNSVINNPNVTKRDEQKYISRIMNSRNERKIIGQEIQKILDRKREHKKHIESGEKDE
jgi:F0F1-type ATP synthase delta subunit